jgi:hypothetical protein
MVPTTGNRQRLTEIDDVWVAARPSRRPAPPTVAEYAPESRLSGMDIGG